jgi:transcriptional regulator with XRE-family HTH domain
MGRPPKHDRKTVGRALAEWAAFGYKRAVAETIADKYGVARTTLYRWRRELQNEPEIQTIRKTHANELSTRDWANQLNAALKEAITRIRELIAGSTDLPAVTEAFKALSEIAVAREVLNVTTDDRPNDAVEEDRPRKPTSSQIPN